MRTMGWAAVAAFCAVAGVRAEEAVSPNAFSGTDSERIEKAIAKACETGVRRVRIPRVNAARKEAVWLLDRAVLLPDDFTLLLDDALLLSAPGVRDNVIRNAGAVPGALVTNRNVSVIGTGHAVLSQGGPARYDPPGDKGGWRSIGLYFCCVENFTVRGVTVRESQSWGMSFERCWEGLVSDVAFESMAAYPNQDGVDIRKGSHHITVENVRGSSGDDLVALTALRHKGRFEPGKPYDDSPEAVQRRRARKERYPMQMTADLPDGDEDIRDIIIRNVRGASVGGDGIVRLLCNDGLKLHDIVVRDVVECVVPNQKRPTLATIRIGDGTKYGAAAAEGDLYNVLVDGVWGKGVSCVKVLCPLRDVTVRNVFPGSPKTKKYEIADDCAFTRVVFEGR